MKLPKSFRVSQHYHKSQALGRTLTKEKRQNIADGSNDADGKDNKSSRTSGTATTETKDDKTTSTAKTSSGILATSVTESETTKAQQVATASTSSKVSESVGGKPASISSKSQSSSAPMTTGQQTEIVTAEPVITSFESTVDPILVTSFPSDFPIETHTKASIEDVGRGYIFIPHNTVLDSMLLFVTFFLTFLVCTIIAIKVDKIWSQRTGGNKEDQVIGDEMKWGERREVVERRVVWHNDSGIREFNVGRKGDPVRLVSYRRDTKPSKLNLQV
ncbi:hypothetical protein L204_105411 [Cryptococcus depauperatus]|nr:hypothetical protein L204_02818 [Cryptococcus depauperatus CBS 7855]